MPPASRPERRNATTATRSLRARRNLYADSDGGSNEEINTSQQSQTSARSARSTSSRTTRNRVPPQNDDESDDDQVLSQLASQRTRPKRGLGEYETHTFII